MILVAAIIFLTIRQLVLAGTFQLLINLHFRLKCFASGNQKQFLPTQSLLSICKPSQGTLQSPRG